jgi:hypothetical protein
MENEVKGYVIKAPLPYGNVHIECTPQDARRHATEYADETGERVEYHCKTGIFHIMYAYPAL